MNHDAGGAPPKAYDFLVGQRFPGGSYTLPSYISWLWSDSVGVSTGSEIAHPGIAYMVGLHGGGLSIGGIMEMFETDADAGVMFGEIEFDFGGVVRADETYDVAGEVLSVDRKYGRKAGSFDRVKFVHRLHASGDPDPTVTVTHTWIIPRQEAA